MSYRFITRATFAIRSASGVVSSRLLEVRAYPSPKRDPVGIAVVDGVSVPYKRTGGKGRGTLDRRYVYVPLRGESAYFEINEAESVALIGGSVFLETVGESLAKFSAAFEADREAAALAAALARDVEAPEEATLASTFASLFALPRSAPVEVEAEAEAEAEDEDEEEEEEEDEAEDESDYYEDESESEAPR